ncbi:hypothetical protein ABK040_003684 [Willaertia magna]
MEETKVNTFEEEYADCLKEQETIEKGFDNLLKEKRVDLYTSEVKFKKQIQEQRKRLKYCLDRIPSTSTPTTLSSNNNKNNNNKKNDQDQKTEPFHEEKHKIKHCLKTLESMDRQTINSGGFFVELFLGKENNVVLNGDEKKKFNYKREYEDFKYKNTVLNIPLTLFMCFVVHSRVFDTIYQLYLTYFYLTLAIRENILRVNGSNIKAWWIRHHYLSVLVVATLLTWPDSNLYQHYRPYFYIYAFYTSIVQVVQYKYQKERLYVRTAIGKSSMLDVANSDSSQVVVEKSLTLFILLPFVFLGQFFQLYNAYLLANWGVFHIDDFGGWAKIDWQVYAMATLFIVLFIGNFVTTVQVLLKKVKRMSKKQQ